MPRIPTYDTPQVETRALPGVRQSSVASPSLFGAAAEQQVATGRGLMQAGTGVVDAALRMQERENADMLFRAETSLKDDYLKFESSVREARGQNAWGVTKKTEDWFAEQEKKHSDTLQNDVQRGLFSQSITKLRQSSLGTVSQYEAGERRKSLEESSRASIVGSINLAAASATEWYAKPPAPVTQPGPDGVPATSTTPRDPISGIKRDILNRVQVLSDLNGWAPERRALEEATHLTNLHKQVIQNLTDKAPDRAREYFEANKAEISGAEYEGIDRVLSHGETKQAGFQFAENNIDWANITEAQAVAAARDHFKDEPEKREAAIREVETRFAEMTQTRERGQRNAADQAWGVFGRTGNINDIPASVLANMDGKDYAALKEAAVNKASGKGVVTDFATYYDLRQQAVENPAEFRKVDLRRYIGKLSPNDLEEMAKLQTAKGSEIKDAATLSQQLGNTHDLLKWGTGDKERKGAFDKAVTDVINTEQQRTGKALDYTERQKVIDRMVLDGEVVSGKWYRSDPNKKFFEVQGTEDAANFTPEIPDAERTKIEAALTRAGKPASDAEVMRLFKQKHGLK